MPAHTHAAARVCLLAGFLALLVGLSALPATPSYATGTPVSDSTGQPLTAKGMPRLGDESVEALRRVATAEAAYNRAQGNRGRLVERVGVFADQAARAAARARQLRAQVDDSTSGMLLDTVTSFVTGDDTAADAAVGAVEDELFAVELLGIAEQGLAQADLDLAVAERELETARAKAAEVRTHAVAMRAARHAIERAQFGRDYEVGQRVQDRRNRKALKGWEDYLTALGRAGIVPPDAEALADPDTLPEPFEPVHDRRGHAVPGVAEVDTDDTPLLVVPAETVRAVSIAFSRVGLPDGADAVGGRDYTCGGLAGDAWRPTALGVPGGAVAQWNTLTPVPARPAQLGDLLYTDSDGATPSRVGVVVGNDLMVVADPSSGATAVEQLDSRAMREVIGARRATIPVRAGIQAPQKVAPECQEPAPVVAPMAASTPGNGWRSPVPAGYAPSARFGVAGPLWSSGQHTGLDFSAPTGSPVFAARGGVVTVERPEWAGRLVRIEHDDGVETWYAHLSAVDVVPGQLVRAGELIGAVGSEGNSTGPHLHFEVRLDGIAADPAPYLGLAPAPPVASTTKGTLR